MKLTKADAEARRADLLSQLADSRARLAMAQAQVDENNKLINVIDGALQENALWLKAIEDEEAEANKG